MGDAFVHSPQVQGLEGNDPQGYGLSHYGGKSNVLNECHRTQHGGYVTHAQLYVENQKDAATTVRQCQELHPYFKFANTSTIDCAQHEGTHGSHGAPNWKWACAMDANINEIQTVIHGSNVFSSAIVDFPNQCSIAVRTEARCIEPLRCMYPSDF